MSDTFSKVEVITGVARRRRFPTSTSWLSSPNDAAGDVDQLCCPTLRALTEPGLPMEMIPSRFMAQACL